MSGLADLAMRHRVYALTRSRETERWQQLATVEHALSTVGLPPVAPGSTERRTAMARIGELTDHRNRLVNRCRAAGLPID